MPKYASYYRNGKRTLNSIDLGSGDITIIKIENNILTGTFDYMVVDTDKSEIAVKGTFSAKKMEL